MRPPPFNPEIRRALRIDVSAALLFAVFASVTTPFIGLILRRELGATPLQLSVMSAAGGACLLLSLAWARALGGRPPLPYLVWPSFVARGLFLLAPLASSAWSLVSLVVAANVFGAAAGPAPAAPARSGGRACWGAGGRRPSSGLGGGQGRRRVPAAAGRVVPLRRRLLDPDARPSAAPRRCPARERGAGRCLCGDGGRGDAGR